MLRADNRHQNIAKPTDNKHIGHLSAIPVDYEPGRAIPAAFMVARVKAVVRGWLSSLMGDSLHQAQPLTPAPLHACDGLRHRREDRLWGQKKDFHHCPKAGMKVLMLCLYQYK